MAKPNATQSINVAMAPEMRIAIQNAVNSPATPYETRSQFVRMAIREKLIRDGEDLG